MSRDKSNLELKRELRKIQAFTLEWNALSYFPNDIDVTDECIYWIFQQRYDFIDREFFQVSMKT